MYCRMASEKDIRDIHEVLRLALAVEPEQVSEPEGDPEEDPKGQHEKEPEIDPIEGQVVPEHVVDDAPLAEDDDQGVLDQDMGAALEQANAIARDLIDKN